jgi:TonB-dependent starch-binding outer membrane protein SusC
MKPKRTCLAILLLLCTWATFAQTGKTVTGVIKDKQGAPVPGASIVENKNPSNGAVSQQDGSFTLKMKDASSRITISLVGHNSQTLTVSDKSMTVILEVSEKVQDEAVVIGYQRTTRKNATASIVSISGKEIANLPSASFDQMLQGRLGGVIVQNFSGEPGVAPTITIRGNSAINRDFNQFAGVSTPLVLVDGVQQPNVDYDPTGGTGTNFLTGINPNDIESIDVLKDAGATAIYGSRGANGVILVTTKKGKLGKPSIFANAYVGFVERPSTNNLIIGAEERRQKFQILQAYLSKNKTDSLSLLTNSWPLLLTDSLNPALNANTDWESLFFRTGMIKNANVGISGGTAENTYNTSLGYYREDGIIKGTGFTRYTGRFNFMNRSFNNKLEINPILSFATSSRQRGAGATNSALPFGGGTSYRLPASYLALGEANRNALLNVYENTSLDINKDNEANFNLNLNYIFNPRIRFSSQNSYQVRNSLRNQSRPSILNNNQGNSLSLYNAKSDYYNSNNFATFRITPFNEDHNLLLTVGAGIEFFSQNRTTTEATRGANDFVNSIAGFDKQYVNTDNFTVEYGTISTFGQATYSFKNTYLLTLAIKRDGSSTFGKNSKWGNFPAISAGWIISNEKFLQNSKTVTFLKLRGSWGISGTDNRSNPYLQYNLYNVNNGNFGGSNNGTYNGNSIVVPNLTNGAAQPDLTWSKSTMLNGGIDVELWNRKLTMSVDVFNRDNTNQLFSVILPVTSGYGEASTNSTGVRNFGMDFQATFTPTNVKSPFQWTTALNFTYSESRIMYLPNGNRDIYSNFNVLTVNQPINAFYLFESKGVYPTDGMVPTDPYSGAKLAFYRNFGGTSNYFSQGDLVLVDQDGDGLVNLFNVGTYHPDKVTIGNPNPKFTGGFINTFRYSNFTLSVVSTFLFGRDLMNIRLSERFANFNARDFVYNTSPDLTRYNMWLKEGDMAKYPLLPIYEFLGNGRIGTFTPSQQTMWMDKGDFFRVRTINLSYDLKPSVLKKLGITRCRIYSMVDNLALWKASDEIVDPENVDLYGRYSGSGYPIPRKITFGVDLNF